MPKVNNLKTEDLNPEQLTALLEAIEQDPNIQAANFMKMALFTGMRRGELFKLQWQDVISTGILSISETPKAARTRKFPLTPRPGNLLTRSPPHRQPLCFPRTREEGNG